MKARIIQAKVLSGANDAALETALNTWFEAAGEIELVNVIQIAAFTVIVFYA